MAKQTLAKAIYRNAEGLPDVKIYIGKKNDDGTLELVDANGELKIGKCKIGEKPGDCYLLDWKDESPAPSETAPS